MSLTPSPSIGNTHLSPGADSFWGIPSPWPHPYGLRGPWMAAVGPFLLGGLENRQKIPSHLSWALTIHSYCFFFTAFNMAVSWSGRTLGHRVEAGLQGKVPRCPAVLYVVPTISSLHLNRLWNERPKARRTASSVSTVSSAKWGPRKPFTPSDKGLACLVSWVPCHLWDLQFCRRLSH